MQRIRGLIVGLIAMAAFFDVASSALATVSINPTTTTATASGAVSMIDSTDNTTMTCTGTSITDRNRF